MNPSSRLAHRRGVSGIEFALVMPVLALLALATVDLVTYIRTYFRLEQVAAQMAEIITQCQALDSPGDMNRFQAEAQIMAGNLNITTSTGVGSFIMTGIVPGSNGAAATIAWQYMFGNTLYGSSMCGSSTTCKVGATATIPGYFTIPSGQVLIATEATASVEPFTFSAKLMNSNTSILHLNSLFLVRSPNPSNLSNVTVNAAGSTTQACGS